ncbi:MAG: D-alanyl-D-alanine carboxypeptidase family protein, partial [Candidatus Competibacter sp.]|nr:D-alanyl-D-alanine carboxypeptidase family protein [Candidatus Competibacter sp.]
MLVATLWLVAGPALAQMEGTPVSAPAVYARSAVLMNPTTGEILFAKEPHLRLPPASTTKILTALVTLERLDLNARVPVSPQAASAPPSRIGLHAGEAALTQDLLYGLMLKSGNDAAETLAEAAGGSIPGFAELMNAKASQIGARDSHFMNPHGLPNEDHYSTAYDLALIFRQAMNHPMFADIVGTRSAALRIESGQGLYGDRMVPVVTHNRLLASYEGSRGGKTGFTFKARRCFVGEVDRGGVRLIVAILNSPNSGTLWQDARALLDYGFARYGLAPRPPVQPEPVPVMVRQEPAATPAARVAMLQREPAARVAMVRPAMAGKRGPAMSVKADKTAAAVKAHGKPAVAAAKPASVSAAGKHQKGKPAPVVAAKTDKADRRPAATKVARVEPP